MTPKEAKEVLRERLEKYWGEYDERGIEALTVAIKALEQQPCEDCISRAEAFKIFGDVHPMDYNTIAYITQIEDLPSVIPQQKIGRWIESTGYDGRESEEQRWRADNVSD